MDFSFSKDQLELQKRCQEFAEQEITPYVKLLEDDLSFRLELFQKMAGKGFFLLSVPRSRGGSGIDNVAYALAMKAIAKADAGISVTVGVTNMVAEAIHRYGSEDIKDKYLPAIAKGECVPLSFASTEKCAGSDVKGIQTDVNVDPEDPDFLIIQGEKQFITNGDISGMIVVIGKGPKGITAYLVDHGTPGLSVRKKEVKLGLLSANLVDLKFEQCKIHKSQILGEEGHGLKVALSSFDSGRIGIAAQALGIGEAAYEAALHHSKQRKQFDRHLCDNQAIAFKLADMKVKLSNMQMMLLRAAWLKDQGSPFTLEASEAKLYCSEACNEIASEALQIFGGYGYVKGYPAEKYFRDARVTTIYEGTSEIQRIVIARHIIGKE